MPDQILFINPHFPFHGSQFEVEFPVHIIYNATYLKARLESALGLASVCFNVLDLVAEWRLHPCLDMNDPGTIEREVKEKIDSSLSFAGGDLFFVVISCFTSLQYLATRAIVSILRDAATGREIPEPVIIVGGYHPTAVPEDFTNLGVDYIVQGEGELVLSHIVLRHVTSRRGRDPGSGPRIVKGIPVDDLDSLPLPDFSLYQPYLPHFKRLAIALSRGCSRACTFCCEPTAKGLRHGASKWRAYSPARANQEIDHVIAVTEEMLGQDAERSMMFYDPIFGFDRKWCSSVLDHLISLESGYSPWAETRIDTISRQQLDRLKKAGVHFMLGLESGSPVILSLMNKTRRPREFIDNLERLLVLAKEIDYGPFVINLIENFPGETLATITETFDFLEKLARKEIQFTLADQLYNVFPGDGVFSSLGWWEHEFGTRVFYPRWWTDARTIPYREVIDASRGFRFDAAIAVYAQKSMELFKTCMENVPDLRYKFEYLSRQRREEQKYRARLDLAEHIRPNAAAVVIPDS
jgi:hypothetical protein